jgi:methylthioribose-1-phosphate isomerase
MTRVSKRAARPAAPGRPGEWFTLRWGKDALVILDQRRLPGEEVYARLESVEAVAQAIESMAVRGAPATGCAAAFGIALAAAKSRAGDVAALRAELEAAFARLERTRPTAVNLFWSLERMRRALDVAVSEPGASPDSVRERLVGTAQELLSEDVAVCRELGRVGLDLVPDGARVLTHCNAGALATGGYGTALGMVRAAVEAGRRVSVLADETRPFLQGARLTAWELARDDIPVVVVTDSTAGYLMQRREVDLVVVGADRVAANGDVANKIGTYSLAVLARQHEIPFIVAAPVSTIDLATASGEAIPIEQRSRDEVAHLGGVRLVPEGVPVLHPAFDVTPAELITAIVTERGIARAPYGNSLASIAQST